jgi:hypothetical protein
VACALLSSYTGSILGQAWLIVQERYPEYRLHCPNPYPVLGEKTFGKPGRLKHLDAYIFMCIIIPRQHNLYKALAYYICD